MKTTIRKYAVRVVLAAVIGLAIWPGTGCASDGGGGGFGKVVDRTLFTPTEFRTNLVPEKVQTYQTNQAVVVTSTNAAGEVAFKTNREPITVSITVPARTEVEPIAWEPNKTTTAVIQASTAFVPGWGELIGWGLTGVLGIWASVKSKRYKAALVATCQGVEHVVTAYGAAGTTSSSAASFATVLKNTLQAGHEDAGPGVAATIKSVLANDVAAVPVVKV